MVSYTDPTDGTPVQDTQPSASEGKQWVDTSQSPPELKIYDSATQAWLPADTKATVVSQTEPTPEVGKIWFEPLSNSTNLYGGTSTGWEFIKSLSPIAQDPVARYKFEGDVTDSVGGLNGSELGSPTYTTDNKVGRKAISLDGTSDGVDINHTLDSFIEPSQGSFAVWFKSDSNAPGNGFRNGDHIFGDDSRFAGLTYADDGSGNELFAYNYNGSSYQSVSTSYTTGNWVHVGWSHGSGELAIYKNGVQQDSTQSGDTSNLSNNTNIGHKTDNYHVDAKLDDALFYDRELSDSEWETFT